MMKKIKMFALCAVFASSLLVAAPVMAADATIPVNIQSPINNLGSLNVSGTGKVLVAPDTAVINITVQTVGATTEIVQKENAEIATKAINKLKELGVKATNIQTTGYSVNPEYDYSEKGLSKLVGYTSNNSIVVKVPVADTSKILSAISKIEKTMTRDIQYTINNQDEQYQKALVLAIKDAQAKAKTIAQALSVTIDKPSYVSVLNSYNQPYQFNSYNNMKTADSVMETGGVVPTEPGKIEITAEINMTYNY